MSKYALISVFIMCFLLSCSCNKKVTNDDGEPQFPYQSYYHPAIFPSDFSTENAKQVAFYFNGAGNPNNSGIYIYSQGEKKLVLGCVAADGGVNFSPSGQLLVFSNQIVWKIPVNGGEPIKLAYDQNGGYCRFPDWSPDGEKIAFDIDGGPNKGIWLMDPEGSNQKLLIPLAEDPAWSPDGEKIYYQNYVTSNNETYMEIFSYNLVTHQEKRLTYLHKSFAMEPTASPSGNLIAFTVNEHQKMPEIWIMGNNGENPHLIISDGCNPVFYSNGEILYVKVKQDDGRLWKISINGTNDQLFLE